MKIIHMADCHLDSVMETHLPPKTAQARRAELLLTFRAIIESAERGGAALVLIAGDLFDTPTPQGSTVRYVLSILSSHEDIRFVIIEGNHDAGALKGEALPENVTLVKAGEYASFTFGEIDLYAAGYGADSASIAALPIDPERKNIMMLHGTLGYPTKDDPAILERALIESLPIDYLALGHYHSHRVERLNTRTTACYAGVPEGRGFDETGITGCVLLETDTMRAEFLPSALRTLYRITVDITSSATQHDIENAVYAEIASIPKNDMVHLTLVGHYRDTLEKDATRIRTMLEDTFYFARLKDESTLALSPEDYKNDISLRGEFVRTVFAAELSDEDRSRILSFGLRALNHESIED